jgi:DNA-binding CsgD family transcriptional regulator
MNQLTDTEKTVLRLVAEDKSVKEIAATMGISLTTVGVHRCNVRRKLGVNSDIGLFKKFFHIP